MPQSPDPRTDDQEVRLHLGGATPVQKLKHPGRLISAGFVVLLIGLLLQSAITNPRFQWDVVLHYAFSDPILAGLKNTIVLTVIAMLIGTTLGAIVAVMRLSSNPILASASWFYVWLFRGTPLLVQLIFWFNLSALYPRIQISLPFDVFQIADLDANRIIGGMTAALLGLSLNQAAYMSEIIRSGILSVDEGQSEAAEALGLSGRMTMVRVVLPQAMRVIIPPTANQTVDMLKTTSLVSVVAISDLLYATQLIYARTFEAVPMLIMASLWYLLLTSLLSVGQYYLELRFGRGMSRRTHNSIGSRVLEWFRRLNNSEAGVRT